MLLLEYDITKKEQVDKNTTIQLEFKANNDKEYKVKTVWDNAIYKKISKAGHLPKLYYLVL